jgi:hypothetical protein
MTQRLLKEIKMKSAILGLVGIALSATVFAGDNRYEINTNPYGSSIGGSTEIEMRRKNDYDPSNKFRGEIESDGSVRMRNYNGDRLRGEIDSDGYGKLRDQDGNTYRIKPR